MTVAHTADIVDNMPLPADNDKVLFDFLRYNPTPVTSGNVADIATEDLKIPRIDPTVIVEDVAAVAEVQMITPSGAITGGSFTMTLFGVGPNSVTTAAIDWNATADIIKSAINVALPNNTISVTGGPLPAAPITLTYAVSYGNVAEVTTNTGGLTGTTPNLVESTTRQGVPGTWVVAGFTTDERTHDGLWIIATGGLANT